ncbi:MAG: RNA polymerase sigma factor [Polyangiaceae bacterium]|nr:RNA polymerase sigma factor [Myxococcales bacterium]MCB9584275.1 RNA polymerase sigma factor [Polyangiaceae bacterium]MCB9608562.1 RNA polymerase sigma factor [Polyangiaceae bacterium]
MTTLTLNSPWQLPSWRECFGPVFWARGEEQLEARPSRPAWDTLDGARAAMSTTAPPPEDAPSPEFSRALAELRPALQGYIRRRLGPGSNHADVEDCLSETLRRALEGRHKLRSLEDLSRWAFGIARHVTIDRRRGASREVVLDTTTDTAWDGASPEYELIDRRRKQALLVALETLPAQERRALIFFHAENKSYKEISQMLGVPLGTVCTWIARARKRLEQELIEA